MKMMNYFGAIASVFLMNSYLTLNSMVRDSLVQLDSLIKEAQLPEESFPESEKDVKEWANFGYHYFGIRCPTGLLHEVYGASRDMVNILELDLTLQHSSELSSGLYLRKVVADALINVQKNLREYDLGLKVIDAYLPFSEEKKYCENLSYDKNDPESFKYEPRHSRGTSVNVTLVRLTTGEELCMSTDVGFRGGAANACRDNLREEVSSNLEILQKTMVKFGFKIYESAWYHFDYKDWNFFSMHVDDYNRIFAVLNYSISEITEIKKQQEIDRLEKEKNKATNNSTSKKELTRPSSSQSARCRIS